MKITENYIKYAKNAKRNYQNHCENKQALNECGKKNDENDNKC